MQSSIIITTIHPITDSIRRFSALLPEWPIILIGDRKTPPISNSNQVHFISIEEQEKLGFGLASKLPLDHYVRKNIGYLYALKENYGSVYDTDDDNSPYDDWSFPDFQQGSIETVSGVDLYNVYSSFTDEHIWPRGYPLSRLASNEKVQITSEDQSVGAWQGLADLDPDIDAIHRLVFNRQVTFRKRAPLALAQGCYCPFNSQNTLWAKEMLAYTYLPASVSFRFTDILRGYIAQRCFWEHGRSLGFTGANVYQNRNNHDLLKDFELEVPVYLQVEQVMELLDAVDLRDDYEFNLTVIYKKLYEAGIVQEVELDLLSTWLEDFESCM